MASRNACASVTKIVDGIENSHVKAVLNYLISGAESSLAEKDGSRAVAALSLNAIADVCMLLPDDIVPENTKGNLMSSMEHLFAKERMVTFEWQGLRDHSCWVNCRCVQADGVNCWRRFSADGCHCKTLPPGQLPE